MIAKPIPEILKHCDNQAALAKGRSKITIVNLPDIIELSYMVLKELNTTVVITLNFMKSADNLRDHFTNGLPKGQ